MHVPIQVDYGIRALVDLVQNRSEENTPVRTAAIAERQAIPEPFLARVMLFMRNGGMVQSLRGPQGGHRLAMDPSEITMAMVMDTLGGTSPLLACLDDQETCNKWSGCSQKEVWSVVEQAMRQVLESTSIKDLADRMAPEPIAATA
jgi:Rrf2 family protein